MAGRVVAVVVSVLGVMLSVPGAAHALPPVCEDATVYTLPNTPLELPGPTCTNNPANFTFVLPLAASPAHGTITPGALGAPNVFTPTAGYHGFDEFKFQIRNFLLETSNITKVTVLIDTPPVCNPATATVMANTSLVLPDVDCTDPDGDDLGILVGDPDHGTVTFPPNGTAVYTPTPNYVGPDSLIFNGEDEFGLQSTDTRVNLLVTAPPPPAPLPTVVPPPPPAPKDVSAPTVALKNASKKQAVAIALTTNENASATLTLALDKATAKKLKLSRSVGTLKAALTPGTSTLKVKLSSKAAKAFKKLKRVKLTLTVVVTDAAGNTTTKTLAVTLKK